jgi:hypothetical protein
VFWLLCIASSFRPRSEFNVGVRFGRVSGSVGNYVSLRLPKVSRGEQALIGKQDVRLVKLSKVD